MKKLALTLLGFGVVGAAVYVGNKVRVRKTERERMPDNISAVPTDAGAGAAVATAPYAELVVVGISEVDPQPITEISGDGVDPEAVAAAHAPR